jgi:RNA-directed DNA polymerase
MTWRKVWAVTRASEGGDEHGAAEFLDALAADLKVGRWRPLPTRRVFIPKPGREELRPLSIPTVRDRVVQAAVKIVIEPIFEADMLECSFGFRPGRSAHDGLQVVVDESWRSRRWVAESDIANCFEAIAHEAFMSAIEERIVRPPPSQALTRDAARRGPGGRNGQTQRNRHSVRRGDLTRPVQRLPASA